MVCMYIDDYGEGALLCYKVSSHEDVVLLFENKIGILILESVRAEQLEPQLCSPPPRPGHCRHQHHTHDM